MIERFDVVDTLVEHGPFVYIAEADSFEYSYLEFQDAGRIHNVRIFSSAQTKLHQTLGVVGVRFVSFLATNMNSKKKENFLSIISMPGGATYKIDLCGEVHPDFTRKMKIAGWYFTFQKAFAILLIIISIPFILLGFGIFGVAGGIAMLWYMRRGSKDFSALISAFEGLKNEFPRAIEL